ncbi:MAG TPA: zf-HC2 domain-containing protein [Planctomycetota bacterium]|nr:zf-HC2 domain-containing protein [Planctomycetota bacterium]HRR80495.1 zf-HC2 domain-containing protein [Planctomycetota bacterium]HRT94913.1 zf-HC2 domain-containing protein [Planctomycetota bacterium]
MNRCPPEERLGAYADGELDAAEAAAVEAHLAACDACAREAAAIRALDRLVAELPTPAVSPAEWRSAWAGIAARIAPGHRVAQRSPWRRVAVFAAAAAACVAIAGGVVALRPRPAARPAEPARECIVEDIEAGAGFAASVSYSADSDVTLITVCPVSSSEAPAHAPNGSAL